MWVVVIHKSNSFFGRVGRVKRSDWKWAGGFGHVSVQFGTDGPFRLIAQTSLLVIADIVGAIENAQGSRYSIDEDLVE